MGKHDSHWDEFHRLLDAGDVEAAEQCLSAIEPLSDTDWLAMLNEAPLDDEPLTANEVRRLDSAAARRRLELARMRQAG